MWELGTLSQLFCSSCCNEIQWSYLLVEGCLFIYYHVRVILERVVLGCGVSLSIVIIIILSLHEKQPDNGIVSKE